MYQFTDDCRLGIPEIDDEHQHLFQMINETHALVHTGADPRLTAENLLTHLKEYADTHFSHEEAYMKSIKDPELPSQKQEHADFMKTLSSIDFSGLSEEQLMPKLDQLMNYLSRWLFHHIIGSDTLIGKFESSFSFTSKYFTGVDSIDTEHEKLFSIISDANDLIRAELLHDKYDEIMRILAELKSYTEIHFSHEEAYMEQIHYPELKAQKAAHAIFIDHLTDINPDDMDDNQQAYLEELIDFLLNWLTVHILQMDKKIGTYAAAQQ